MGINSGAPPSLRVTRSVVNARRASKRTKAGADGSAGVPMFTGRSGAGFAWPVATGG
jgi:hypothetical protein